MELLEEALDSPNESLYAPIGCTKYAVLFGYCIYWSELGVLS